MEIKVGEFIRTNDGYIAKIIENLGKDVACGNFYHYEIDRKYTMPDCIESTVVYEDLIVKHSPNIIDLIEVGDYVNGERVEEVFIDGIYYHRELRIHTAEYNDYFEKDVETIVTKEQFKNVMYEVK